MSDWARLEEVSCFARPAVVSFRRVPARDRGYDFYRRDSFLSEKEHPNNVGILWHFGGEIQRRARHDRHEPLVIECVSDPVALAVQETPDTPAILDVFTVDRDRNLWHRRFSPPPSSFLPVARRGCLWATFDSLLGRRRLPDVSRTGWHALGRCESTPAACSKMGGGLAVVARRGEQLFFRRFSRGRGAWDSDWILIAAARSAVDPVAVWHSSVVRLFTVTSSGELYMYSLDHPEAEGIRLGNGFALLPPAIANGRVFALSRTGQLLHRHPDTEAEWQLLGDDPARRWATAPVVWYYQPAEVPEEPPALRRFSGNVKTYVFVRDGAGHLWASKLTFSGTDSTAWEQLPDAETLEFDVIQITGGVALYARGLDNRLMTLEL